MAIKRRAIARSGRSAPSRRPTPRAEARTEDDRPEIPLRELRNSISRILGEVAGGRSYRITVSGRPVADLVPASHRRTWVPWAEVARILRETPLDENFLRDVDDAVDQSTDPT